jgi:hypothetical protein
LFNYSHKTVDNQSNFNIMTILGIFGPIELFLILFVVILPVIALVDIVKSNFEGNNKLVWILIVCFFNILGSILYFIIGKNQKISQ